MYCLAFWAIGGCSEMVPATCHSLHLACCHIYHYPCTLCLTYMPCILHENLTMGA